MVTKRVIDSPTVRVRGDDSDSEDDGEEDFGAPLIEENPEHYVDTGYTFESLDGVTDTPSEFQLEIQFDISIVSDCVGFLDTNGDGISFTTGITVATALANSPPQEGEEAAAASAGSSASSPVRSLPVEITQTGTVTPVSSITHPPASRTEAPYDNWKNPPMNRFGRGRGRGWGRGTVRVKRRSLRTPSLSSVLQDNVRTKGPTLESRDSEVFDYTL